MTMKTEVNPMAKTAPRIGFKAAAVSRARPCGKEEISISRGFAGRSAGFKRNLPKMDGGAK